MKQLVGAALCIGAIGWSAPAHADDWAAIVADGRLTWAADQEGGGPFLYPSPESPDQIVGFEVDLAAALAQHLGVTDAFTQGAWDTLPAMVQADKVHIVLNGYEWTPERAAHLESSMPYFVYALQLMAREDDTRIHGWTSLQQAPSDGSRWQVGVLGGSAAEEVMVDRCRTAPCDVTLYDGNTDAMRDVVTGRLDVTLQDTPIVHFYGPMFPNLRPIEAPVSPGTYVIYAKKGETELISRINTALIVMLRTGELESIYKKHGLWDSLNQGLTRYADDAKYFGYSDASLTIAPSHAATSDDAAEAPPPPAVPGRLHLLQYSLPILVQSALMTVLLAVVSFPIAIALGIGVAVGRMYGPRWMHAPLTVYVEFLRGTPLMLQLYFVFFVLPEVGINIPALATAILGLAVNYSAYESEIYRSGLQAIPKGQMEAALSLGLTRAQAIRHVILPQAFRIVIPPVVNDFIALFKDTSVCSVITIVELTKQFSILSKSSMAVIEMMGLTAVLYLAMSYPLSLLSRRVEKAMGQAGVVA